MDYIIFFISLLENNLKENVPSLKKSKKLEKDRKERSVWYVEILKKMEVQLRRLGPTSAIKNLTAPADGSAKVWLAGRGTCCHIYTKSKYASRKHFSITFREKKYFISDLQSINGTFLNDEKLTSEKILNFGDTVSVGVPSTMQNTPDCLVYIFELLNPGSISAAGSSVPETSEDDSICIVEETLPNVIAPHTSAQIVKMEVDRILPNNSEKNSNSNEKDENESIPKSPRNESLKRSRNSSSPDIEVEPKVRKLMTIKEEVIYNDVEGDKNEVEIVENKPEDSGENEVESVENNLEDDDLYQALTQVDEVKTEEDFFNYSLNEELIEITDSEEEEDWSFKELEPKEVENMGEEEEEDDIIFIEEVKNSTERTDLVLHTLPKIEDDLTETDKKWMGKLFKIKKEGMTEVTERMESVTFGEEQEMVDGAATDIPIKEEIDSESTISNTIAARPSFDESYKIPDIVDISVEEPQTTKKVASKKSVSFDLVPKIKYFEVPGKVKFTAVEKGRMKFFRIIFNICKWNTVWLEECKKVASDKVPPDISDEPLRKIPKKFVSHTDYMSSFIPVMLLDLWNKVKENWKQFGDGAFRQTVSCDFCEDYESKNLCVYKCTGLVQNVDAHKQLLKEGHLVILRLHQIHNSNLPTSAKNYSKNFGYLVFGFIQNRAYERFQNQPVHEAFVERCASTQTNLHLVRLSISVKMRPNLKIDQRKLIQITVVDYISSEIRKFRAICFLPESPLCKAILKPNKSDFSLMTSSETKAPFFKGPLDVQQKAVVLNLSHTFASTQSFLYNIHGAAGTGKGQVILALILELLFSDNVKKKQKPKIIYCTHSTVPLDEMVRKLKTLRDGFEEKYKFNLVRVGSTKDVKPDIKNVCLVELAKNHRPKNKNFTDRRKADPEVQILKQSDIICTTSSSSGMYKVIWAFEDRLSLNKNQKLICIIDEAMQCSEPTSLLPLLLGVTHLLLVGDRYQSIPPYSGEKTNFLGLDISLFWRMYKNFTSIPQDLWPMCELKTQHRMNPSLAKFLTKLIYNNVIENSAQNNSHKVPNLQSHLLLVDDVSEDLLKKKKNEREGQILVKLVKAILNIISKSKQKFKVSVITCDLKQNQNLSPYLPKNEFPDLEINPVYKFQGRETDVVIFPYNGNEISMPDVTVAVTRAKFSLIILTNRLSIASRPWFVKLSEEAEKEKIFKCVSPEMTSEELEKIICHGVF